MFFSLLVINKIILIALVLQFNHGCEVLCLLVADYVGDLYVCSK